MKLCTAAEMMDIDRQAIQERGIPGVVLMENAGRACFRHFIGLYADLFPGPALVVAGKGNNGGDGYVIARLLADAGWQVKTLVLGNESDISGDAGVMLEIMLNLDLAVGFVEDVTSLQREFSEYPPAVVIDAIFGTGLNSPVRGLQAEAIRLINSAPATVFAVDIPSGVNGSDGRILGDAVRADLTVTFDTAKIGHGSRPGADYAGQLEIVDIGIPQMGRSPLSSVVRLIDSRIAADLLPQRSPVGHKGRFGHLLVVAGSRGKTGAAALAGSAAARSGCGLVTVAVPASVHDIIEIKLTEVMSAPLADRDGLLSVAAMEHIRDLLDGKQALAIGPGLGVNEELRLLIRQLLEISTVPIVIDADGLNLLSGQLECLRNCASEQVVLTPHPGEMARLSGMSIAEIEADRFNVAGRFAREHGVVLLLKGPRTVIAAPDGRININSSGNDGLASGGSGDVLTGIIGSLMALGLDAFAAASMGAWTHGRSAEVATGNKSTAGMVASDLLACLPIVLDEISKGEQRC